MKRSFLILLVGIIALAIIFLLRPKQNTSSELPLSTGPALTKVNSNLEQTIPPIETVTQTPPKTAQAQSGELLDATKTQSITEWTNAIPNFKLSHHFRNDSSWVMAQIGEPNFPKVTLTGASGSVVQYPADFIDIDVSGDQIQRIDLHSPKMNIDNLRQLGNQLLELMGKDTTQFNAWCDKVGNRWMDQPEFSSGNAQVPNSDKSYGFSAHPTFDNNKPWYIYFVIADK